MKLKEVEIVNFRSIQNTRISFDPTCRILVGINESGKSNILKALAFLNPDHEPATHEDIRESLPNEDEVDKAYIQFFLEMEKSDTDHIYNRAIQKIYFMPSNLDIAQTRGEAISFSNLCAELTDTRYYYNLVTNDSGFRYTAPYPKYDILDHWMKPKADCPDELTVNVRGETKKLKSFSLIDARSLPPITRESLEKATNIDLFRLFYTTAGSLPKSSLVNTLFWQYDEKNLLPSQISISEFAEDPDICLPLKNMFVLAGISEIGDEIERQGTLSNNRFQNFLDRVATKTTTHFRSVWQEYKGIEFQLRLDSDKIIPAIKEQNSYDFSKRSDGFKRFVTFLLMISVNVKSNNLKNTMLLIDEPDAGLHPSGAKYLRDELIHISQKNYVAYSTHSIFMIDAEDIERHYIVTKKREVTSIEAARDTNVASEEVLLNALGYSIFEILREKNFIFEGWKDKRLFSIALEKAPQKIRKELEKVGRCHAKGAKHIKTVTPMIELANRACWIISDSDGPAKEQQSLFKKERGFGEWWTYQDIDPRAEAITGEDFVTNAHIANQVNLVAQNNNLPKFDTAKLKNSGKLAAISNWLKQNGLNDQQTKDALREIKDHVFDKLKPSNVEEAYFDFLKKLSEKISE